MAKQLGIQKSVLQNIESSNSSNSGYYSLRKILSEYFNELHVPFSDILYSSSAESSPVRYNSGDIERYDVGTNAWITVPGASGFFPNAIISADGSGNLTDNGPVLTFDPATAQLNVYDVHIGRGLANEAESLVIGNSAGTGLVSGALANTFIGFNSGNGITQGDYNVAIGWKAMRSGSVGFVENTVAIGQQALAVMSNASGRQVAIGAAAAGGLGGTSTSVFIGYLSGFQATSDGAISHNGNVGVGANSLYKISATGGGIRGSNVTAVGYFAGAAITTGTGSTYLGTYSGGIGTCTGDYNTGCGSNSLLNMSSGSYNIGLGHSAGSSITTGSYNVVIGSNNGASIATSSNNILIADGQGNLKLTIDSAHIFTLTNGLQEFADDAAAAVGGIPVNGLYRTASAVKIRVA